MGAIEDAMSRSFYIVANPLCSRRLVHLKGTGFQKKYDVISPLPITNLDWSHRQRRSLKLIAADPSPKDVLLRGKCHSSVQNEDDLCFRVSGGISLYLDEIHISSGIDVHEALLTILENDMSSGYYDYGVHPSIRRILFTPDMLEARNNVHSSKASILGVQKIKDEVSIFPLIISGCIFIVLLVITPFLFRKTRKAQEYNITTEETPNLNDHKINVQHSKYPVGDHLSTRDVIDAGKNFQESSDCNDQDCSNSTLSEGNNSNNELNVLLELISRCSFGGSSSKEGNQKISVVVEIEKEDGDDDSVMEDLLEVYIDVDIDVDLTSEEDENTEDDN